MTAETQPDQHDEENLVCEASKGNLEDLNDLVLRYQNLAYHQALSLPGDPALAEDATQDSFIRVSRRLISGLDAQTCDKHGI